MIRDWMKKVVQFISFESIYNTGLQKELQHCERFTEKYEIECINLEKTMHEYEIMYGIKEYSGLGKISKFIYWVGMNRYLSKKYVNLKGSILNIQFVSVLYVMMLPFLVNTFDKIILSFWGSDLLRQNRLILFLLRLLINKSDLMTFQTKDMADTFRTIMGNKYDNRIHVVRFGNYYIDGIDNAKDEDVERLINKYCINTMKKVVAVGYSRFREHQHIDAIKSIIENNVDDKEIFIVIPWTYGPDNKDYKDKIEALIKGKYEYIFLTERLPDIELVALRKVIDIQIIVETTDALNGTMLEAMYAGEEVIIGSWLSYEYLYECGINMWKVDNVSSVGEILKKVLHNPMPEDKRLHNREIVKSLYSWNNVINDWAGLY